MKIKCPQCGAKNEAPTNRCDVCGVGFTVEVKPDNQSYIAVLAVIFLIVIIGLQYKCPARSVITTTTTTSSNNTITKPEDYEKHLREKK